MAVPVSTFHWLLFHLPGTAAAAHPDILKCTAKSGCLMSFKVVQADKDIRIHNRSPDQRALTIFPVWNAEVMRLHMRTGRL
mgnify:CR=1 FL=1